MLNVATLMGRLTRDPELRQTQSGTSVCSFSLAIDRNRKDANGERQTDFVNCVAWGKNAEFVSQWFTKGMMAIVVGSIQSSSWEDENGNKRSKVEVNANNVQFGETKKARESQGGQQQGGYQDDYQQGNQGYQQQQGNQGYQQQQGNQGYQQQQGNQGFQQQQGNQGFHQQQQGNQGFQQQQQGNQGYQQQQQGNQGYQQQQQGNQGYQQQQGNQGYQQQQQGNFNYDYAALADDDGEVPF